VARYSLNLPTELKREAERFAVEQGVSLNQFILWAVAEKVGGLAQDLDDPRFPKIHYRQGASGAPCAVIRGTAVRVRTVWAASTAWSWSAEEIAREYGLRLDQVEEALSFAAAHEAELEADLTLEEDLAGERA